MEVDNLFVEKSSLPGAHAISFRVMCSSEWNLKTKRTNGPVKVPAAAWSVALARDLWPGGRAKGRAGKPPRSW